MSKWAIILCCPMIGSDTWYDSACGGRQSPNWYWVLLEASTFSNRYPVWSLSTYTKLCARSTPNFGRCYLILYNFLALFSFSISALAGDDFDIFTDKQVECNLTCLHLVCTCKLIPGTVNLKNQDKTLQTSKLFIINW